MATYNTFASPTTDAMSATALADHAAAASKVSAVLRSLDGAKTQAYHFVTVIIAGMGFFADAYDLFCIGLLTKLLGRIYFQDLPQDADDVVKVGTLPISVNGAVTSVALGGTLVGQLLFGYLGDRMGRKKVYGFTLVLMILSSAASALSFGSTADGVFGTLCFFRFLLGVGVGGDYPLSAVIMSEYSSRSNRGAFVAAVFAMQGVGIVFAALVVLVVAAIFRHFHADVAFGPGDYANINSIVASCPASADMAWRIVLAVGCVPAAATMYLRLKMPETARFTAHVEHDASRAVRDMENVLRVSFAEPHVTVAVPPPPTPTDVSTDDDHAPLVSAVASKERQEAENTSDSADDGELPPLQPATTVPPASSVDDNDNHLSFPQFMRRYGLRLFGCCSTWFLLDVAFYSQNLFQKDVFSALGWIPAATTMSAFEEMYLIARAQALIAIASTIPGYWFTVFTIERMGRWRIQMMGFAMMTICMVLLTAFYDRLMADHVDWFVALYALTFFFANWGPNATTFVIPAEVFPTRWRSTAHGMAAAAGKMGAIIGAFGFLYASQDQDPGKAAPYPAGIGLQNSLIGLAAVNFTGLLCTFCVPETKDMSLEELSPGGTAELKR